VWIALNLVCLSCSGDLPTPPFGHPSQEGILYSSFPTGGVRRESRYFWISLLVRVGGLCITSPDFNRWLSRLLVHGFEGGYGGGGLPAEVAEDPVFEDGVDKYGEGGDEEGVELLVFGDAEVFGCTDEDDFPAVGGMEADEGVGEEDDDKCFGGVADTGDEIVDEGFEHGDLGFAIDYQPGEGDDR
jgi:hypothetical protein